MTDRSPIDEAHAAMERAPEDDAARLHFYERVVESELFLMLERPPEGDVATPRLFDIGEAQVVLAFDREERLVDFAGSATPYAALSGRMLIEMLDGQGISLGLNLEVAPSSTLLPQEAVAWLMQTLGHGPDEAEARMTEIAPPKGLPETLLRALDAKLAMAMGLAQAAFLVNATYENGTRNHHLAFLGTLPGAETALARAVAEALTFSGLDAAALDVSFPKDKSGLIPALTRHGLRFDLPQPVAQDASPRPAPGSDPAHPPKLR